MQSFNARKSAGCTFLAKCSFRSNDKFVINIMHRYEPDLNFAEYVQILK